MTPNVLETQLRPLPAVSNGLKHRGSILLVMRARQQRLSDTEVDKFRNSGLRKSHP
jgi:hypothetical protein